jgi:hypothetical protein
MEMYVPDRDIAKPLLTNTSILFFIYIFMSESTPSVTYLLAVDSHVHLYNWVDLVPMLDTARASFTDAVHTQKGDVPFCGMLVLTEPRSRDTFPKLRAQLQNGHPCRLSSEWMLQPTDETLSLTAVHSSGARIFLISGQQVVTREALEVLAIASEQTVPDRQSLQETLKAIRQRDGYPILPWAVGKWLMGRGKLVSQTIIDNGGKPLGIGDNGGRPVFWTMVGQFEQARRYDLPILRGSDPLPVKGSRTAGSYGTLMSIPFDAEKPAKSLLDALCDKSCERIDFGVLETPLSFVKDQIALRLS